MRNMETRINKIATQAIEDARLEANASDSPLSTHGFDCEVDCLVRTLSFENEVTKAAVIGLINRAARKLHPEYFEASKPADEARKKHFDEKLRKKTMERLGASNYNDVIKMAKSI